MGSAITTSSVNDIFPTVDNYQSRSDPRALNQKSSRAADGTSNSIPEANSYQVTISKEALRKAGLTKDEPASKGTPATEDPKTAQVVDNLKGIDREVRAHEQAHIMAGGSLVRGGASFGYAAGPDGKVYAVSGEVSIDTSPVSGDPQATIRKMAQVSRAALAPAQPSGQDRSVASAALNTEMNARQELSMKQAEKMHGKKNK